MPKFNSREGFAAGIIFTGIVLLVVYLLLFLNEPSKEIPQTNSYTSSQDKSQDKNNKAPHEHTFWKWDGWLVAAGDTAAQWIMTIFTIIAAGLLYLTLRSANKTNEAAMKANEIMRQEQRPWLKVGFEIPDGIDFGGDNIMRFKIHPFYKNIGNRPAINAKIWAKVFYKNDHKQSEIINGFQRFVDEVRGWYYDTPHINTGVAFPNEQKDDGGVPCRIEISDGDDVKEVHVFVVVIYSDSVLPSKQHITAQCYGITSFEIENYVSPDGEAMQLNAPAIAGTIYEFPGLHTFTDWLPNQIT